MVYEFHKSKKNLFETADMPFNQQFIKQSKSKEFELISVYFLNLKNPQPWIIRSNYGSHNLPDCYGSVAHISRAAFVRFLRANTLFKLVNTWVSWHPTPLTSMLHFIPQIAWNVSPIRITLQFVAARSISSYTSLMNYKEPNFTLPSQHVLHVRTQSWKERENFGTLTKQKDTNCAMVSSQHTPYVSAIRGKFHTTQSGYPWTSGPVLHVRTQNWKERKELEHSPTKRTQKCNGQQSALNPWLPDLEVRQPLASYWGIEYRRSSSTNQSKQEYCWTNSEWSTKYRRAFNIDM